MARKDSKKAIIVGAGFAGLAAAIELATAGIDVEVLESAKELTTQGDILLLSANATRIMSSWGDTLSKAIAIAGSPSELLISDKLGKVLLHQPLDPDYQGFPNLYISRGLMQKLMYEHAVSLGVKVTLSSRTESYFEEGDFAGVVANSVRRTADFVLCADGVHSKARAFITGKVETAQPSGFAVYRSWFPLDRLKNHPLTKKLAELESDYFQVWIGEDVHAIVNINAKRRTAVCFCTHKDSYTLEESWSFPGKIPDMLKVVEGWDETLRAVMQAVPPESLIDWKLLWRDPINKWVSDGGRIVLIGDAAHPHLATSGSGAAQAIEDGATIAATVSLAGNEKITTALRAFQVLRYDRTSLTQRMGWETRHRWHQTDWSEAAKNPDLIRMPQPAWLFGLDARQYAHDNYAAAAQHVEFGTKFLPKNVPEGYQPEEWSIDTMMAMEGKKGGSDAFYKVQTT